MINKQIDWNTNTSFIIEIEKNSYGISIKNGFASIYLNNALVDCIPVFLKQNILKRTSNKHKIILIQEGIQCSK